MTQIGKDRPGRPLIGLALGSGAARGWAHIGVLEALHEIGIEPDVVCGTSMGAFVGAGYASGRLRELKEWATRLTWRGVVGLLDVRLAGGGVIDGAEIITLLNELRINASIEQLPKTFGVVATSLVTGREIWLRTGPVADAVRASIGIPGIFRPIQDADDWLVDGGLVNPVPVSLCRALGADIIVAVNLNNDLVGRRFQVPDVPNEPLQSKLMPGDFVRRVLEQVPPSLRKQAEQIAPQLLSGQSVTPAYFEVLANALNIMEDQITRSRLAGEPPHVMLAPRLQQISAFEFHRAAEAIAEGRASVEQALPYLRRYL
jgi:NTE family protein